MLRRKLLHFQLLMTLIVIISSSLLLAQSDTPLPLPASGLTGSGEGTPEQPASVLGMQGEARAPFTDCTAVIETTPVQCQVLVDLYNAQIGQFRRTGWSLMRPVPGLVSPARVPM
jgi:hypothetical protein